MEPDTEGVDFILLLCAFLGLVLEIKMPGTFIPIACSAVCFLLLFIGGSFPAYEVTGVNVPTTSAFEIVFFVVGMGLVVVELLPESEWRSPNEKIVDADGASPAPLALLALSRWY